MTNAQTTEHGIPNEWPMPGTVLKALTMKYPAHTNHKVSAMAVTQPYRYDFWCHNCREELHLTHLEMVEAPRL